MKKMLLLVPLVCIVVGHTQTQVLKSTSADSSFRAFLSEWEKAQARFINGDPTLWKQNSSHRNDATILGAFGGYGEKGWDAVGSRYDWASSQYKGGGATLQVEYINIGVSGDLGFTVAIERQEGARVGDQQNPTRRALRVTQIFRKEDGAWKLLHRHADPLIEKQVPSTAPQKPE
jgi:ketosteroid isomerase-like protein